MSFFSSLFKINIRSNKPAATIWPATDEPPVVRFHEDPEEEPEVVRFHEDPEEKTPPAAPVTNGKNSKPKKRSFLKWLLNKQPTEPVKPLSAIKIEDLREPVVSFNIPETFTSPPHKFRDKVTKSDPPRRYI